MVKLRTITLKNTNDAREFLIRMGVSDAGTELMVEKCFSENILIKDMKCGEANVLKQEMLTIGGDAAIHRDVITGRIERSDVLLMGSRKQLKKLARSLKEQSFSLPEIGREIERVICPLIHEYTYRNGSMTLGDKMAVMGIINVTPDSFSDGGKFSKSETAAAHAMKLEEEGADILDIGGESSRPGADKITAEQELERVIPVMEQLNGKVNVPLSIDTRTPEVAKKALEAGACIINDITGFRGEEMIEIAASSGAGIVIMHMQGDPETMQENPVYDNVIEEVLSFLSDRAEKAAAGGVKEESIMLDPGIGFGKTTEHNLALLNNIEEFRALGFPVLVGTSRKSFIGNTLGLPVDERLPADISVSTYCALNGVDMVRVHDVKESVLARDMVDHIVSSGNMQPC